MFHRLGRFVFRYRWQVLLAAVVFMGVSVLWGSGVFNVLGSGGYAPDEAEASQANQLLEERFGHRPGDPDAVAVFDDESGTRTVDDPAFAERVQGALAGLPSSDVISVISYWTPGLTPEQRAKLVSPDRHATYAVLTLQGGDDAARLGSYGNIQQLAETRDGIATFLACGCEYELQREATTNLARAQAISLPILLVLLVIFYRGLVAAVIPVALGIFAILGSLVLLRLLTTVTDISIFALEIVVLIGLGLAVDYGLFVVSRFREELDLGSDIAAAVIATTSTAGRTVAISGLTVMSGLSGLLLFPQRISHSFALGGISVVLFNIVAALIVLPAALSVLGSRINAGRVPLPRFRRSASGSEQGGWARLARIVTKRPAVSLTLGVLVLLIAAAPLLGTRPGLTNHRYLPIDNHAQIVASYMNVEFPPDGPAAMALDVAVRGPVDAASLETYADRLAELPGASTVRVHLSDPALTWVKVSYRGEADDPGPLQLVRAIRAAGLPPGATEVLVGGRGGAAVSLDSNAATLAALPQALGLVAIATLVLLALAFRSVFIPIKAVICAFLSLAASLGIVVWAFQEGGLAGLLGFHVVGTTDLWTLGLITTIAFGLVTDYEMFLVSRMREVYLATGDNTRAVEVGLQQTGTIITRAAILMIVVLATMGLTAGSLFLITFGIGMTLSVVIDATIVRAVVVPAAMQLLGAANWWAPRPLAWLSDRLGLGEGSGTTFRPDAQTPAGDAERLPT